MSNSDSELIYIYTMEPITHFSIHNIVSSFTRYSVERIHYVKIELSVNTNNPPQYMVYLKPSDMTCFPPGYQNLNMWFVVSGSEQRLAGAHERAVRLPPRTDPGADSAGLPHGPGNASTLLFNATQH